MMGTLLAAAAVDTWPFVVLAVTVAFVIGAVLLLRLHPFLALVTAALLAGGMADGLPPDPRQPDKGQLVRAVELTTEGLGRTAGGVAIAIAMATVIGMALTESGAADKVVRRFLAVSGPRPGGIALAIVIATYLLSIPIFFDSMFMLMVPMAMALALRTGGHFTLYVLSICAGAENLGIDVGLSIWIGIVAGILPVLAGWLAARWLDRQTPVPVRGTGSVSLADARGIIDRPEAELPSLAAALLPILLPILLITAASLVDVIRQGAARHAGGLAAGWMAALGGPDRFARLAAGVDFLGNKNVALVIGAVLALVVLARQKRLPFAAVSRLTGPPLETAGVIILITAAGGAFGFMLTQAGLARAVEGQVAARQGIDILLLGYAVALVFRVAQGSATVAMQMASVTCAGLVPLLECHPIYLFLAIGFGATGFSWMNDSGFWVVSRLAGFTERETLRTWTPLLTAISVTGLAITLAAARLVPLPPPAAAAAQVAPR